MEAIEAPEANLASNESAIDYAKDCSNGLKLLHFLQLSERWQMLFELQ
ncbi:MAG: hypothetical protein M3270_02630 [Thermoproteota archaeon]|nr:hypothetical protein [Thermoproteota archaeon]